MFSSGTLTPQNQDAQAESSDTQHPCGEEHCSVLETGLLGD